MTTYSRILAWEIPWTEEPWRATVHGVTESDIQFSSVAQLCLTFCDPMNCSMPGFPVHHQRGSLILLPLSQTLLSN